MDLKFRDPDGSGGGFNVSREVAATLRDRPGEWAVIEEHPLPARNGNDELERTVERVKDAEYPARMTALVEHARTNGADRVELGLLEAAAKADDKEAADKDTEVRVYGDTEAVARAVLAQQVKRVRARASSRTGVIKGGRVRAFYPAGTFDSKQQTQRDEDGVKVAVVFARYLGEEHAWPAEEQPDAKRKEGKRAPNFPEPAAAGAQ